MRIAEPQHLITATMNGTELARSTRALKIKEVAFDIYDPVIYFPREAVAMDLLKRTDKTTHCPIKGDTEYFDVVVGERSAKDAAWSYTKPLDGAKALDGLVAFDTTQVQIVEHTAE